MFRVILLKDVHITRQRTRNAHGTVLAENRKNSTLSLDISMIYVERAVRSDPGVLRGRKLIHFKSDID